jgi:hypothetical protein
LKKNVLFCILLLFGKGVILFAQGELDTPISSSKNSIINEIKKNNFLLNNNLPKSFEIDPLVRKTDTDMLLKMGIIYSAGWGVIHYFKQKSWWANEKVPFHIYWDMDYSLEMDKVGHFYAGTLLAHAFGAGLEASNMEVSDRIWLASGLALLFHTYVEIEDGFAPEWGFSPPDMACNVFGASLPILQYYEPFMNNFRMKLSYYPKYLNQNNPMTNKPQIVIDDYEGQKYWVAAKLYNLLPEPIANYWPKLLGIAFGMGVSNVRWSHGQRDFYLALDIDTEELPLYGEFWQFVKRTLNFIHLPMPGVRLTNGVAFFGLCF